MIRVRKSNERGHIRHGWLNARHTFSFGRYFDPDQMGFRVLRVINNDRVQPGTGFAPHSHKDMEIITYVLEGAIRHRDSLGNSEVIKAGEVQVMSAGTGVEHSEFNESNEETLELYQIWIEPDQPGHVPCYDQRSYTKADKLNQLKLIVSGDPKSNALFIHQDANLYATYLEAGHTLNLTLKPNRHAWIQVISGHLNINDTPLEPGDGAAISDLENLHFTAPQDCEFLTFDLP